MQSNKKEIFYTTQKPYSTLNTITKKTKNVWFVCHGLGYLSNYFVNYFKGLNAEENYIIAPQAPSLYYQNGFKHVGACWLTKENTINETENIMNYFDAILVEENVIANTVKQSLEGKQKQQTDCFVPRNDSFNLIVFGYSQGVSVATRYIKSRQLQCEQLILHSGGLPKELIAEDFSFLNAKVSLIYGTEDEYLNEERIAYETERAQELFGNNVNSIPFNGKHVVNVEVICGLV